MVKFSRFFFLVVLFALFVVASLVNVQNASAHGGSNGVTVLSNGTVIVNGNRNHHSGGSISANGVRIQSFGGHGGAVIINGGRSNANRFNQNGGFNGIGRRR